MFASCYKYDGSETYTLKNNTKWDLLVEMDSADTVIVDTLEHDRSYELAVIQGTGYGEEKKAGAIVPVKLRAIRRATDSAMCKKDYSTYGNWDVTKTSYYIRYYTFNMHSTDF